jgi:hypothetical protein
MTIPLVSVPSASGAPSAGAPLYKRSSRAQVFTTGAGSLEEQIDNMFGDALADSIEVALAVILR